MKKFWLYFSGLVILGVIAASVLGHAVEYRQGQPVATQLQPQQQKTKINTLASGTVQSLKVSADAIEDSSRAKAMHALNTAERTIEVGRSVPTEKIQIHFEFAHVQVSKARHYVQNGHIDKAVQPLRKAATTLSSLEVTATTHDNELPEVAKWPGYNGGQLINANGTKIGEFERFSIDSKGNVRAHIDLGGYQDILGFIDIGGQSYSLPANDLLYGHLKNYGSDLVVVPTLHVDASQIIKELETPIEN